MAEQSIHNQNANDVTQGIADVGGTRIVYEATGTGPPLVCCHAFGVNRAMWQAQRARFSANHRLITFDQRGTGESDHPRAQAGDNDPYTLDAFAEDLRGVLDAEGLDTASILGFSMGAATALRFATRWPERVERLVLASAMASRLPTQIIQRAQKVVQVLEDKGLKSAYEFYFAGALFDGLTKDGGTSPLMANASTQATAHGFRGCFRVTIERESMVGDLHRITSPTVILVGERDVHYLADAELMAQKIPNAHRVVVPGVGHAMSLEAPDLFADEVLKFLNAV